MKILSKDLRERAARAMGVESSYDVAARLEVSSSWVRKLWVRLRETGSLDVRKRGHRPRKVDSDGERMIRGWIESQSDLTVAEVMARYAAERGIAVSEPAMRKTLNRMGLSRKKRLSLRPSVTAKRTSRRATLTPGGASGGSVEG